MRDKIREKKTFEYYVCGYVNEAAKEEEETHPP